MRFSRRKAVCSIRRAFRRAAWSFFAVSVVVNLWQAPLPWLHRHTERNFTATPGLARHLAVYHTHQEEAGWHLHFSLLSDIVRGTGCPVPAESNDDAEFQTWFVIKLDSAGRQCDFGGKLTSPKILAPAWVLPVSPNRSATLARGRNPLERHTASRTLLSLICVSRC